MSSIISLSSISNIRKLLRFLALFIATTIMVTAFAVWGSTYTNDDPQDYYFTYDYSNYSPDYYEYGEDDLYYNYSSPGYYTDDEEYLSYHYNNDYIPSYDAYEHYNLEDDYPNYSHEWAENNFDDVLYPDDPNMLLPEDTYQSITGFSSSRPAIAVNIVTPEGSNRDAGVYVDQHYDDDPEEQLSYYYQCNENHVCNNDHYLDFLGSTPIYHPNNYYRDIQLVIPPPRYTFFDYDVNDPLRRPRTIIHEYDDPDCTDCCIYNPTIIIIQLQVTPPSGYTIVDLTVNNEGNLVVRIRPIYTVTFHLRGGHVVSAQTDATVRINRLQGGLIELGEGNITDGHPVTGYPFFNRAAMPQRGVPQPNPTRQNSVFRGWREINTSGEIVGAGTIISSQDLANLRVSGNRYFEAVYTLRLAFYVVDSEIYNNPFDINEDRNTLTGAMYQLRCIDNVDTLYTTTASGTNGNIVIGGSATPPASLILPSGPTPETMQFRIVQTAAPTDFVLPSGHWVVTVNIVTGELVSATPYTSNGGNPAFIWRPLPSFMIMSGGFNNSDTYQEYSDSYIGIAPTYEYNYWYNRSYHAEVSSYGHNNYYSYHGEIGDAPDYIPFVPFGPEIEHAEITHPDQLQAAVNSVPNNGVPHIIRLNFPASVVTTINVGTVTISFNRNIILDSATGVNQVWNRNQSGGRHIQVNGTLELRNVTLSRDAAWVSTMPNSTLSGGVGVSGMLIMNHANATISNNTANPGGGVFVGQFAHFYMHDGNIINNRSLSSGGGVSLDGVWDSSVLTMTGGRISNNTAAFGGGIGMCCAVTVNIGSNAQIYGNTATNSGGGIHMGGGPDVNTVTMTGGSVHANHANISGGGIHRGVNNSPFVMPLTITGGDITLNTAGTNGGGIYIPVGGNGSLTINGGNITRNHAGLHGGGLFIHHSDAQMIPEFIIGADVTFSQNVAGSGMRVNHVMNTLHTNPGNVLANPGTVSITPVGHAFTNHDINSNGPAYGWHVANNGLVPPDWIRLNSQINFTGDGTPPTEIVIHPRGGTGPITADERIGNIFHLVITDPDPVPIAGGVLENPGQWITTVPITGAPSNNYPHNHHPHRISVTREVRVSAVAGANITLLMAVPQAATTETAVFRTSDEEPYLIAATANNLGRHFIVGAGGEMLLGSATGSVGTGNINVHGNSPSTPPSPPPRPPAGSPQGIYGTDLFNRGGINITGGGHLRLQQGGAIRNSRRADTGGSLVDDSGFGGGGVTVRNGLFTMYAGSQIFYNIARVHGGGVFAADDNSAIIMNDGIIRNNFAIPTWLVQAGGNQGIQGDATGGGGVHVRNGGSFTIHDGAIHNNRAHRGGGVRIHAPSTESSTFIMNGGNIHNNFARADMAEFVGGSSGAGVLIEGGSSANPSRFYMNGGRVHNNESQNSGGGVYARSNAHVRMRNETIIEENRAIGNHGGGMWLDSGATLLMCNLGDGTAIVRRNRGNNGGGGLHLTNGASFIIHYAEIYNNLVTGTNLFYGAGGGIRLNATAPANGITSGVMYDGRIYGNRGLNAGGVWVGSNTAGFGSQFTMHGGVIEGNWTTNHTGSNAAVPYGGGGGGVLVHGQNSVFTMNGGAIRNNITARDGGGVLLSPSNTTATADGTPAGTNRMNGGTFNFNGGIIEGNRAANGGGIFSRRGVINIQNNINNANNNTAQIHNNTAGIVSRMTGDPVDINNISYITETVGGNGGGIHIINTGAPTRVFTMEGGSITFNRAIMHNNNGGNGGGVFLTGADAFFNMYGGSVGGTTEALANSAIHGGGVMLISGTFNLRGSTNKYIRGNTATFGGGVFVGEDANMVSNTGSSNVRITNNAVTQRGGGIFSQVAEYGTPLTRLTGTDRAYYNLHLRDIHFSNNTAGHREFSPFNALDVMPRPVDDWTSLSVCVHPFNNYDINFIGHFELPLTGATGMSTILSLSGATIIAIGIIAIIILKNKEQILLAITLSKTVGRKED